MEKTCYIVGAGHLAPLPEINKDDVVIAADGGYDALLCLGITPDLLVGDMDSISSHADGVATKRFPVMKDETDSHLCYLEGKALGAKRFLIYGGVGGRADHTFANYQLLFNMRRHGDRGYLIDDGAFSFIIENEGVSIEVPKGADVSVFAFGGECREVKIKGLVYEADGITLSPDFPLGVSNSSSGGEAKVSLTSGAMLIMIGAEFGKCRIKYSR